MAPAGAQATISCNFTGGVATVDMNKSEDGVLIRRSGDAVEILATSFFGFGPEVVVPCAGGPPTVTNTDKVVVNEAAAVRFGIASLDLRGGPLAPGLTPEADGTSEIELEFNMFGRSGEADIGATAGPDTIELGTLASGQPAANLNGAFEATPDADVTFSRAETIFVAARQGSDRVTADGGPLFNAPLFGTDFGAVGGPGNDVLSTSEDFGFAVGGQGRDRLLGNKGVDFMFGGGGRDVLLSRGGRDLLVSEGGGRDRVDCGAGRDIGIVDRRDNEKGCNRTPKSERAIEEAFEDVFDDVGGGGRAARAFFAR
jgi:Ca2+-binding RTX toxin-like protein